jgi:hypothetical protein
MFKDGLKKVPILPLSALLFYLTAVILWQLGIIPSPMELFTFLESLYDTYGLIGLFIGSFLEGIVYFGLYFPGGFIVALAVILSDGAFFTLLILSLLVATAITITSIINYSLGRKIIKGKLNPELPLPQKRLFSKGFLFSFLHPTILAFYFFNLGIKKENGWKIALVPFIMIPYGLLLA